MRILIDDGNYSQAVQDYTHAQKVLHQYGEQPSFQGIQEDCLTIVTELKERLRQDFRTASKSAQTLTEIGDLLLQLGEKPSKLAKDMLQHATQRLHEQIVSLQVN